MSVPVLRYGRMLRPGAAVEEAFREGFQALLEAEREGQRLQGVRLCWSRRETHGDLCTPAVLDRIGHGPLPEGRLRRACGALGAVLGAALAEQRSLLQGAEGMALDLRPAGGVLAVRYEPQGWQAQGTTICHVLEAPPRPGAGWGDVADVSEHLRPAFEAARGAIRAWLPPAEDHDAAVRLGVPWPEASAHQRLEAEALHAALLPHLPAGRQGPLLAARIGATLLLAEGDRSALMRPARILALTPLADPD